MNNKAFMAKEVTFLIYVRIESDDRLYNLSLLLKHINKYFATNISVLEVDDYPKIPLSIKEEFNIDYEFIKDENQTFHTTKYRNYLVKKCNTPFFFICDTDVIPNPKAIIESVDNLSNHPNEKILVYPYNGDFFNVPKTLRDEYALTCKYDFLEKRETEFSLWFKYSTGGVFGGVTAAFKNFDIDNETIFGWGPDDKERYYRLKGKGFSIKRANYPLYHLYHDRNDNSKPKNISIKHKNKEEYLKCFL